ncbi:hypothetical protein MMC26_003211 [Xylographa opegraphella]|nr:hypothetical protein [Xylographa opegraphella]
MTSPPLALHISEDFLPSRRPKTPGTSNLSFSGFLSPPLRLHEDLKDGCGGQLWPAGMVLARYLLERKDELRGKVILELGAGGGLVGLAVALALSQSSQPASTRKEASPPLLITDLPILLPLQASNIALNALPTTSILSHPLPWGSPLPAHLPTPYRRPEIILAADCVYYEPAFPLLLETLEELLGIDEGIKDRGEGTLDDESTKGAEQRRESVCYFCMKKRRKADMRFVASLKRVFEVVEVKKGVVDGEKGVFLYEVRSKKGKVSRSGAKGLKLGTVSTMDHEMINR